MKILTGGLLPKFLTFFFSALSGKDFFKNNNEVHGFCLLKSIF